MKLLRIITFPNFHNPQEVTKFIEDFFTMERILLFIIGLSCLGFSGCVNTVYVKALKPADINLPGHFQKIAVAERTRPTKENQAVNIIEGVLSGEGILADRDGGLSCLNGLTESLLKTPRYTVVQPAGLNLKGSGTANFPPPLTWEEVEKICNANNADALVMLEAFDSNSLITFGLRDKKVKSKEGVDQVVVEHVANMRMNIITAWRVYDFKNKVIVDEFKGTDYLDFTGVGGTPQIASSNLPNKREAIKRTGYHGGSAYGYRIAPQWVTLHRDYYIKGSQRLKQGKRLARVGDWEGAAKIYQQAYKSSSRKESGRAAYNMALVSEVLGNLDAAKEWAKKSYTEKGIKRGLAYSRAIERRMRDEKVLERQMESQE